MHALEKIIGMAKDVVGHVHEAAAGSSSFRVFIGNSSPSHLAVVGEPHVVNSTATLSFARLWPGRAGLVRVEGHGENGAALEFSVGDECFVLGMHWSRIRAPSFVIEFANSGGRQPSEFYRSMPHEFAGMEGSQRCIQGSEFAVLVGHVTQGAHDIAVHLLLGPREDIARLPTAPHDLTSRSCIAPGVLASGPVLDFADWCYRSSPDNLPRAIFVQELSAVQAGLARLDPSDRAFTLDVMIAGFVTSGILDLGHRSLDAELQAWRDRRPAALSGSEGGADARLPRYDDYRGSSDRVDSGDIEAHIDAALLLLKAAAMQCAIAFRSALQMYHASGEDGSDMAGFSNAVDDGERWGHRRTTSAALDTNCVVMEEHLAGHEAVAEAPALSTDEVQQVMTAAQQCIQDSAMHTLRRGNLFRALEDSARRDPAMLESIQHYRKWAPATRHCFEPMDTEDGKASLSHESWGPEVLAGLDGGRLTDPDKITESLGFGAPPYKSMSTNSKSGEFFFFSADRRFLIKTVSEEEAFLLFRMLPAYQAHIHKLPGSLIVRYAGLHCANIPGRGFQYFTVMVSLFDPQTKIQETFDVKGSMHKRKKKDGESIGKDEDWVEASRLLHLPEDQRLELREAHEQDAAFLASFKVMDYSLLIGITHRSEGGIAAAASSSSPASPASGRTEGGGLIASDGNDLYFVGLIDFLIAFTMYKKAEHLLRVVQGHAEDASCTDPASYAKRQVRFVQDRVLAVPGAEEPEPSGRPRQRCKYGAVCYRKNAQHKTEYSHPGDADWDLEAKAMARADRAATGRLGTLRVGVNSARNLINADIGVGDVSDPYVTVSLGLQRARTHTVMDCLDPEWKSTLRLAVDEAHKGLVIKVKVWDEDHNRTLQGSDDFLGSIQVPLARVMQEGPLDFSSETLQGVDHGEISLCMEYVPREAMGGAAS